MKVLLNAENEHFCYLVLSVSILKIWLILVIAFKHAFTNAHYMKKLGYISTSEVAFVVKISYDYATDSCP